MSAAATRLRRIPAWGRGSAQPAQAQRAEWRSSVYMNGFSQACQPNNWFPQDVLFGNVRYRPSGLGTNGPNSQLSYHFPVYAYNFTLDGGRFDRTARIVTLTAVDSGGWTYGQTRVRVTTQVPNNNNLSETSPQIHLVGEIRNFEDITGCSVSFEAILMRRR